MRIMMCLDGSEGAAALVPVCRQMAESAGAEVHLVRVSPHDLGVHGTAWSGSSAVDIRKHERAEQEDAVLRAHLEEVASTFRVPTHVAVLPGAQIADELVRYARAASIDLIAIGCHEYGPLHGGVGGETLRRVSASRVAPILLGPVVRRARFNVRGVPAGCPVFSRDGMHVGDVARITPEYVDIRHAGAPDVRLSLEDVQEVSMDSGVRLAIDRADIARHRVDSAAR